MQEDVLYGSTIIDGRIEEVNGHILRKKKMNPYKVTFPKRFKEHACVGDTLSVDIDGVLYTAHLEWDDDTTPPDKRQDGFWPSLNPKDCGYIGPRSDSTLRRHMKRANETLRSWENGEWGYVGIIISAEQDDGWSKDHLASLWGLDMNYPYPGRRGPNTYLTQVANELLQEAYDRVQLGGA